MTVSLLSVARILPLPFRVPPLAPDCPNMAARTQLSALVVLALIAASSGKITELKVSKEPYRML